MKLLTSAQRARLLVNGRDPDADHVPVVKFFNPVGSGTWLITEADPGCPDVLFGLCDLGMGMAELGSVSLAELESWRGPGGLGIERDRHFRAKRPISAYVAAAGRAGCIVENGPELDGA